MPGKVRKNLRDKTLHNVLISQLSESDKRCIIEVFVRYERMLDREIDPGDEYHKKGVTHNGLCIL